MREKLIAPKLTQKELETVNEQKCISRGCLTLKELNIIKKKIYEAIPDDWEVKISKCRANLSIDITPSDEYLNMNKIILDGIDRINSGPLICACDALETFRDDVNMFLGMFNIVFDEGDISVDLPCLKRFCYFVTFTFNDESFLRIKRVTQELYKINQAYNTSGFYVADFNRLAKQVGLQVQL